MRCPRPRVDGSMTDASEQSLGGEATFAGGKRPQRADVSLGDERTLSDGLSGQETILDDIEVIDLEARYRVEGTLGQGGMGAVLLATDTRLDRKVAIKRILGEAAGNRMAVNRFLTEAKSIAALNHPNVVQIYDYGRANDGPFLIMEYVDGGSLLDRCRDGAIPLESAVDLACQLCDGLAKAHDLGIIHRDIKPANVLLTKDGIPKLTDFGLAKAQAGDHGQTMTGAVLGTPDFMPPEQRRDASLVDHRSDLWSLAATVYQMVTGRSPKVINLRNVPPQVHDVLGKALEDEKELRYQSARELRDALKTSLRATAATVEELVQGQCPSCGVKNDSNRRFCRGCGESLETPCLSCTKPMPVWEEICGSCGAKQTPLVDGRRQAIAVKQAEAEGLLGDCEFERAAAMVTQLRDEQHPKLKYLSGWLTSFLEQIEKSRAEHTRQAVEAIAEAGKHEAAYDYVSARVAIESIPNSLLAGILPGMQEPAAVTLKRLEKKQTDVRRLEGIIKDRVAAKQLDALLPDVERFLVLQPARKDVQKIRGQLLDRQTRQVAARDEAVAAAELSLAAHEYERAQAVLATIPAAAVTPDVMKLRERAEALVGEVRGLAQRIKEAVASKSLEGLLPVVQEYLGLKPDDAEAGRLLQSLEEREERFTAEIATRLKQASALSSACRFDEAAKLLQAVPEPRRSPELGAVLDQATRLAALRGPALKSLAEATEDGFWKPLTASAEYRWAIADTGLEDAEFAALAAKVEVAHEEQRQRARRKFFFVTLTTGAGIVAIVALVMLLGVGWWIRSALRASLVPAATLSSLPPDTIRALPAVRNSLGVELRLIPAGTFTMGEATGDTDEKPPHQVTLTKPFYMGVHEVTNAQWKRVMGSVPSNWKDGDQPVENVSWEEAVEFCRKLSDMPEERTAGRVYRLPTEAEWEYACRAETTTQYSFGDDETRLGDYGWFDGNLASKTHAVGQKMPNAWGLYDMHGNVSEWCSDCYGAYSDGESVTNPQGLSSGSNRVFRGGSWGLTARDCRSASRNWNSPSTRRNSLGFRLAMSPSGAESPEAGK